MLVEISDVALLPDGMPIRLTEDVQTAFLEVAKLDCVPLDVALQMCVLVGADFLRSDFWGCRLSEYYDETGSFSWLDFLDFCEKERF